MVNPTNGVEVSWPMPASKASWGVHVEPPSSEQETHIVWKVSYWLALQPAASSGASAAIQPTMMRPACGWPGGTMPTPAGTVLQNVNPSASDEPSIAPGVTAGG